MVLKERGEGEIRRKAAATHLKKTKTLILETQIAFYCTDQQVKFMRKKLKEKGGMYMGQQQLV